MNHGTTAPRHYGTRFLIIQLARFGDLMQTVPVIKAIRTLNPAPDVHLLVNDKLIDLAQTLPGVARVIPAGRDRWFRALDNAALSWGERAAAVKPLLDELQMVGYERVINLTHTPESAYLTSAIGAGTVRGLVGTRAGIAAADEWERWFQTILHNREVNNFNLVDIHKGIAGVMGIENCKLKIEKWKKGCRVAIQLGANKPERKWAVHRFAETANRMSAERDITIVLVGSNSELGLAEEFLKIYKGRAESLVGKTSLVELREVIEGCDLLVSGDTGTLHLAAALGVPSAAVFLGMARAEDTAPYLEGCAVFEPHRECYPCPEAGGCQPCTCGEDVPPELVAEVTLKMLNGEPVTPLTLATCRMRVTEFNHTGILTLAEDKSNHKDTKTQSGFMTSIFLSSFFNFQFAIFNSLCLGAFVVNLKETV